jgi:hypothetical protein
LLVFLFSENGYLNIRFATAIMKIGQYFSKEREHEQYMA